MEKILLMHPDCSFEEMAAKVIGDNPDVIATSNLEQVLAMIKSKEIERVCIMYTTITEPAWVASSLIHELDPLMPVLICNPDIDKPASENEIWITSEEYDFNGFHEVVHNFFSGTLLKEELFLYRKRIK